MSRNHTAPHGAPTRTASGGALTTATRATGTARRLARTSTLAATLALIESMPGAAFADPGGHQLVVNTLPQVIANLQGWVMGILAALATLFLVLGGVYRVTAGGDPSQVDKSNTAFRNALTGYGLAVLAPVLLEVVKGIVGG